MLVYTYWWTKVRKSRFLYVQIIAVRPKAHKTVVIPNAIMKRIGDVCFSFSSEIWKTIAFSFSIVGWTCGALVIVSAIIVYVAKANVEIVQKAPRSLTSKQTVEISTTTQAGKVQNEKISVLIISIGGPESEAYANQIQKALNTNAHIARFSIGTWADAPRGLSVLPNGHDPEPLLKQLANAGLKANVSKLEILPVPASVQAQFSGFVALLVGPKPSE
jgi:hypothetical protein